MSSCFLNPQLLLSCLLSFLISKDTNLLTGSVPSEIGLLTSLTELRIGNNELTGCVNISADLSSQVEIDGPLRKYTLNLIPFHIVINKQFRFSHIEIQLLALCHFS